MKKISIKEAVGYGWRLFKEHKKVLVLSSIIMIFLGGWGGNKPELQFDGIGFVFGILLFLLSIIIQIGWIKLLLNLMSGKKVRVWELFDHSSLFFKYLVAYALYLVVTMLGFILLVVPGIYLGLKYMFVPILAADKEMKVSDAFQ